MVLEVMTKQNIFYFEFFSKFLYRDLPKKGFWKPDLRVKKTVVWFTVGKLVCVGVRGMGAGYRQLRTVWKYLHRRTSWNGRFHESGIEETAFHGDSVMIQ